jgi:DNA-binding NtrC family response regulator
MEARLRTPGTNPSDPARVLIVEDELRLRELLVDVIPEMGFRAVAVRSAEEAKKLMESDPYEIVMLDLQLPVMGGMDFFEQMRQRWPATQVIILTGFGNLAAAQQAIRLDVVDFLSKPCHLNEVELSLDRAQRRIRETATAPQTPVAPSDDAQTLADNQRRLIFAALDRHNGNRTAAAAELGISRRTLHYRLREYLRDQRHM